MVGLVVLKLLAARKFHVIDGHSGLEAWHGSNPWWPAHRSTRCRLSGGWCLFISAILGDFHRGGSAKARVGLIGLAACFLGTIRTLIIAAGVLGFASVRLRSSLAVIVETAAIVSTFHRRVGVAMVVPAPPQRWNRRSITVPASSRRWISRVPATNPGASLVFTVSILRASFVKMSVFVVSALFISISPGSIVLTPVIISIGVVTALDRRIPATPALTPLTAIPTMEMLILTSLVVTSLRALSVVSSPL